MLEDLSSTIPEPWDSAGPNDCHYCYKPFEPYDERVVFGNGDAHPSCSEDWFRREGLDPATNSSVGGDLDHDEIDNLFFVLGSSLPDHKDEIASARSRMLSSRLGAERSAAFGVIRDLIWAAEPTNRLALPLLNALRIVSNVETPA